MKKVLFLLFMCLPMLVCAQTWEKKTEPADVIKGTPERAYYTIDMDSVTSMKVYADNGEWYLRTRFSRNGFKLKMKMFQMQMQELQSVATFGFLDTDGNIARKTLKNIKMTSTERAQVIGSGRFTGDDAMKVSEYLKSENGFVQIIAPLHMGGEFNMKIPCIPEDVR